LQRRHNVIQQGPILEMHQTDWIHQHISRTQNNIANTWESNYLPFPEEEQPVKEDA
jgi:hypothetical protein